MDFTNRGLGNILNTIIGVGILVIVISLFTAVLPYVLLGGLLIWGGVKAVKAIKGWKNKRYGTLNRNKNEEKPYYSTSSQSDLSQEIIDVDFTEIK